MSEDGILSLDEQLSVTNPEFLVRCLLNDANIGSSRQALYSLTQSKAAWVGDGNNEIVKAIIEKEKWFREILKDRHILIDIVGLIGSGKTTLGRALAQSAGGCVVPAYAVEENGGGYKFATTPDEKLITIDRKAAFLAELPSEQGQSEISDILPHDFEWNGLEAAKLRNKRTLADLYNDEERKSRTRNVALRIQEAYLGCRSEQAHLVAALANFGYSLSVFRDGSPFSDRWLFSEMFLDEGSLRQEDLSVVDGMLATALHNHKPAIILRYTCSAPDAFGGIQKRQRPEEIQAGSGLTLGYVEALDSKLSVLPQRIEETGYGHIPVVDVQRVDFLSDPIQYINVLDTVGNAIATLPPERN
jgi:deoxyadenosine/deoxycytidine kinase